MASKSLEFDNQSDNRPVKLFFQDEARFGRIDNISSCWVPPGGRASVGKQIIREYTYAYLAVCPETGENYSLIMPYANKKCMDIFMQGVSETFSNYRIIMAMDGASWHTEKNAEKLKNIVSMLLPAYSPELNPVENMWHHIREKGGFKNTTFHSLKDVELKLAEVLKNLDKETVKSIAQYKWIIEAIC
jgi:transposase